LNHGVGVKHHSNSIVRRNEIVHNGQLGVGGEGIDMLVERNVIAHNNALNFDWGWEGGGGKWFRTRNMVIRDNHAHSNLGPGLWTDTDNIAVTMTRNLIEGNRNGGIFHEASYDAVFSDNTVTRNGLGGYAWGYGAGILVAHSPNVQVLRNVVSGNARGIIVMQQPRGSGAYGPLLTDNIAVRGNTVSMDMGFSGVVQDVGDIRVFSRNIKFKDNTYTLEGDQDYFAWNNSFHRADEWQDLGKDPDGGVTVLP
jgi:hypothetical protein